MTKSNIEAALVSELRLKEPHFILEKYEALINGSIISPTFNRKGDRQRQIMIWDALEKVFGPDANKRVGMLLAYTPDEWDPFGTQLANGRARSANCRAKVKSGK